MLGWEAPVFFSFFFLGLGLVTSPILINIKRQVQPVYVTKIYESMKQSGSDENNII